ncbi:MAG: patatin-like phospholipase family protein [Candidatus Aminicenantes bacterium]|nr:patatin-like phospholipase family protein [Candidatus Aminicenantes bacterium]
MKTSKTWALVLMGGGARGLAHVGVIRVLEKHGLVPDVIAGTSMGALVGGLHAAGLSGRQLTDMLDGSGLEEALEGVKGFGLFKRSLNLFEALMLTDTKNRFIKKIGVDKSDAIEAYLKSCVGNVRIEDLPVKFLCNAVDLVSGREVMFTRGKLARALRATMSLPLVFAPVRMRGMLLLDGGVLNSAPVEAARAAGAEVAVLVDVHRPVKKAKREDLKSAYQILQRTVEVAAAASFEERARRADFVLRVPVDLGVLNFDEPRRIARKGERAAKARLEELKAAIGAASST